MPCGLTNLGNTCFLNSCIQLLNHTYEIIDSMQTNAVVPTKYLDDETVLNDWLELRNIMFDARGRMPSPVLQPGKFVHTIHNIAMKKGREIFTGWAQNDLPEFLLFMIECIHNARRRSITVDIRGSSESATDDLAFSNNVTPRMEGVFDRLVGNENIPENYINQYYRHVSGISPYRNPYYRREVPIVYMNATIGLTETQIAAETQSVQYDASMNGDRCPITWDRFEEGQNVIRINRCGHVFGEHAIIEWFRTHDSCPVCRTSLTGNTHVGNTHTILGNIASRHTNTSNGAVNQLVSTLLATVNNAINSNGFYENEVVLDVNELFNAYNDTNLHLQ